MPLVVPFHDDHTSILDDVHKGSFAGEFLNSAIQNHVEFSLRSPLHKGKFPFLIFLRLLLFFVPLFVDFSFIVLLWFLVVFVERAIPDDRDISGGTDIVGS